MRRGYDVEGQADGYAAMHRSQIAAERSRARSAYRLIPRMQTTVPGTRTDMSHHLRIRVRREIEKSRSDDGVVDVHRLATSMSEEIDGESSTTSVMLQRMIIDECSRAGFGMRVGGPKA